MNKIIFLFSLLTVVCITFASFIIFFVSKETALAESVAASNTLRIDSLNNDEVLLSCIINSEAGRGDIVDYYLIGSTVLNRMDNHMFPECLTDVIFQKGQYDGVSGHFSRTPLSDTVAYKLMRGLGRNRKVLFFYNYHTATDKAFIKFLDRRYSFITLTKNHKFYGLCEPI